MTYESSDMLTLDQCREGGRTMHIPWDAWTSIEFLAEILGVDTDPFRQVEMGLAAEEKWCQEMAATLSGNLMLNTLKDVRIPFCDENGIHEDVTLSYYVPSHITAERVLQFHVERRPHLAGLEGLDLSHIVEIPSEQMHDHWMTDIIDFIGISGGIIRV